MMPTPEHDHRVLAAVRMAKAENERRRLLGILSKNKKPMRFGALMFESRLTKECLQKRLSHKWFASAWDHNWHHTRGTWKLSGYGRVAVRKGLHLETVEPRLPKERPATKRRLVEPQDWLPQPAGIKTDDELICYLPSPEVIAAECRAIQMAWTTTERLSRRTHHSPAFGNLI